jgi:hypothetical protein
MGMISDRRYDIKTRDKVFLQAFQNLAGDSGSVRKHQSKVRQLL